MDDNPGSDYKEHEYRPAPFTTHQDSIDPVPAPPPPPTPFQPPHEHEHEHPHHTFHPHDAHVAPLLQPIAPPPPPAQHEPMLQPPDAPVGVIPQPVVRVLSPHGVEYVFLTIALVTGAAGLISALLAMVNGKFSFSVLYFPLALLLVSVPIFSWLFLRLKRAELINPALRLDASKRRSTQFIQIFSFLICFFTLITLLTIIFNKVSGSYQGSIVKVILDVLVILVVTGGILFYYWNDEHKAN